MIWFALGREYKLSIAEILAIFPSGKVAYLSKDFLILNNLKEKEVLKKADNLWWTIKIIKIEESLFENHWLSNITNKALGAEWKFKYWLSIFWEKKNMKDILIKQKKELKAEKISSRFVNKDFKNLTSAQILWEKLIDRKTDFNYIYSHDNVYFWVTIWIQNINSYSKRDYSKDRDMQVGMLPPKLCQMMINLSWWKMIYDPFVGLWTVLIESINMWNKEVYGSDLNEKMVESSTNNIKSFIGSHIPNQEVLFQIEKLNSKFIHESGILESKKVDSMVTEWYLWEVMTRKNISLDRIEKQKKSLINLYEWFFKWLQTIKYSWNLVICFPFWEIKWKYVYFNEIYDILAKYCSIELLFPKKFTEVQTTKSRSLLYKRDKQLVGREIFKLKINL